MTNDLKILYVSAAFIAPPHTGCMIRTMNIARKLKKCGKVTILAVARNLDEDSVKLARKEFDDVHLVKIKDYAEYSKTRGPFLKKYHMHWPWTTGRKANDQDQKLFQKLVATHDIVWFHTLGAANPFRFTKLPNSVMDLDDLNHCKYTLRSNQDKTLRLRLSAKVQAFKWKRHEFNALKRYKNTIVCSQIDKELLGSRDNIHVVPNGFTQPETKPQWKKPDELRLGFIGTLGYWANRNGLIWFKDHVWPLIREQKPNMTLRIVGSLPPKKNLVEAEGFEYLGYIEDTTGEFQTWSAMIVPLLIGGGTRIKIIESFSKMCPVISTPAGAHGIQAKSESHFLLRENPEEFAKACLNLSENPELGKSLAENGWTLLNEKYTWKIIGKEICQIVNTLK